jgi:hypothetical protein
MPQLKFSHQTTNMTKQTKCLYINAVHLCTSKSTGDNNGMFNDYHWKMNYICRTHWSCYEQLKNWQSNSVRPDVHPYICPLFVIKEMSQEAFVCYLGLPLNIFTVCLLGYLHICLHTCQAFLHVLLKPYSKKDYLCQHTFVHESLILCLKACYRHD